MEINPCPAVITLKDGKNVIMFKGEDFMELVDQYMGNEACKWLWDHLQALEEEADYTKQRIATDLQSYESDLDSDAAAFEDIKDQAEIIMEEIQKFRRLDRIDIQIVVDAVREIEKIVENQT